MVVVATGKQGSTHQHFGKNASHSPHINGLHNHAMKYTTIRALQETDLCVHLERKHNLRCTIPSRRHIFSHQPSFLGARSCCFNTPRQAKVADFKVTISIEQQVRRFQISMDNVGAMYRLEGTEDLVNKVLNGRAATIRSSIFFRCCRNSPDNGRQ
jgi:hypothetical protein